MDESPIMLNTKSQMQSNVCHTIFPIWNTWKDKSHLQWQSRSVVARATEDGGLDRKEHNKLCGVMEV